ncbi:33575_t:CDS:2, partial [Racocetra persica]
ALRFNLNNTYASAGIDKISQILSSWNVFVNNSKLVLGVEFGGIVEIVSDDSNNIKSDIESQQLNHTLLSSSSCSTNLISLSQWTYGFISNVKQPYFYQQQNSSNYYVIFYEDYQSLNAKLDYIKNNNLAGIAIADITKDSKDLRLTNFILGILPNNPGRNENSTSLSPNIAAIVGGVIGSIIFVSALVAVGIILYRRRHKPRNVVTTVIAMFDYVEKEANNLSFKAGDVIEVLYD